MSLVRNQDTLCPGLIDTPRLRLVAGQSEEAMGKLARDIPLGHVGCPEDLASLVALLVSPGGRYVTGTTIPVDGELHKAHFCGLHVPRFHYTCPPKIEFDVLVPRFLVRRCLAQISP